jgi:GNAT superfamily N-acetyltransferase
LSGEQEIRQLNPDRGDAHLVYPVIAELRTHLEREEFIGRYLELCEDGFRMIALCVDGEFRAAAGFRWIENLAHGKSLYVADLVTAQLWRSHGHGAALLNHLEKLARSEGAQYIRLDSGVQRKDAHRFYEREGYVFLSQQFVKPLIN